MEPCVPARDMAELFKRQLCRVVAEKHRRMEVGETEAIADEVVALREMRIEHTGERAQHRTRLLDVVRIRFAQTQARLDHTLEEDRAGMAREMRGTPVEPAQDIDARALVLRPQVRSGLCREMAYHRRRLPQRDV